MLPALPVRLQAVGCVTAHGDAPSTYAALMRGEVALRPLPVLGADGGEPVPLALAPGRTFDETAPPNWLPALRELKEKVPDDGWGSVRRPIFITSSNFGVGSLYAYRRQGDAEHLKYGTPHACVEWLAGALG